MHTTAETEAIAAASRPDIYPRRAGSDRSQRRRAAVAGAADMTGVADVTFGPLPK